MHQEPVKVRITSSEWWAVVGRPTKTSVLVARARADGRPHETVKAYEACGICFAGDPTAEDERQRRPGFCAPPIVMGHCTWCGFVHDPRVAQAMDVVTSDAMEVRALQAQEDEPELP